MLRKLPEPQVDEVAIKAIRCTVHNAIRRGRFPRADAEDLVHEAVVSLLRKMDCFDPCRSSWPTFCAMVARNFLSTEAKRRQRRRSPESLSDHESASSGSRYEDAIEDHHVIGRCFSKQRTRYESIELREDISTVVGGLAGPLRNFCEAYLEDASFESVATSLGLSRQTVYRRRQEVRERVWESLEEYQFDI